MVESVQIISPIPLPTTVTNIPLPATISNIPLPVTNPRGLSPIWFHGAQVSLPAGGTIVSHTVPFGKQGFIYGFLATSPVPDDILLSWISSGTNYSIRITFGSSGTIQDTEEVPNNEGLPADPLTLITLTAITGSISGFYQGRLLIAEV